MERVNRRHALDLLLWVVITAPVLIPDAGPDLPGLPLPWLRVAAVPLFAAAALVARRSPVLAAAIPAALSLAATPELLATHFVLAQTVLVYLLGRRAAGQRAALLLFAAVAAVGVLAVLVRADTTVAHVISVVVNTLILLVLPWAAGRYLYQNAELARTGFALAEKLERERELAAEQARLRERSRIARDMHDSLGHELSLLALRAAALQVAPDIGPEGERAAGELRRDLATVTERLREVIGVLREEGEGPPTTPADDPVAALVRRAEDSGLTVALEGALPPVPPMTDRAVHRVVQEALTNAAKHAPGAPVTVTLRVDGPDAVVTVRNPAAAREESAGWGLVGLDERVRHAGGTLDAGLCDGTFTLSARLPLTGGAPAVPRELTLARRNLRRSAGAIWVPVAVAAVLVLLGSAYDFYASGRSVLEPAVYRQLRVGEQLSTVETRLPVEQIGRGVRPRHAPADPPGADECRFYRSARQVLTPAYRLCFTGGRLSTKDEVTLDD
ncbi:two-component sensor histidine kinase [Virgisporangium aliadipatigenens]|uniref:histidine kinase n=1 Tax=Virgisporangium aliadipatigenens TaxID=741659 RepID=A0A8J3YS11_9ACTN|nr:histidine kinase [Virgisporangium aliadipatigenens]GIJ48771.1 two-component sensor histidine kinase [Virgisporangium aliadipatigenens]